MIGKQHTLGHIYIDEQVRLTLSSLLLGSMTDVVTRGFDERAAMEENEACEANSNEEKEKTGSSPANLGFACEAAFYS